MDQQKHYLLKSISFLLIFQFVNIRAVAGPLVQKTVIEDRLNANLIILDKGSRAQLASQEITLVLTSNSADYKLQLGSALAGYVLKTVSKKVKVNSKDGFLWIEATLFDKDEKVAAYMTATVPSQEFTIGVGFANPKDSRQQFVLMINRQL